MTKAVEKAIEQISHLPEEDQENIGRTLLSYVEKLRHLRSEIEKGIRSLDAGEGRKLDIEEFIRGTRRKYGTP